MTNADKRTQIYLTADQHRRACEYARRQGSSMASVVREALDRYLAAAATEADWSEDPALDLIGALELPAIDGDDLDEAINRSVYEE
jgi:hypothetical protein